jgi:hypothetical protein
MRSRSPAFRYRVKSVGSPVSSLTHAVLMPSAPTGPGMVRVTVQSFVLADQLPEPMVQLVQVKPFIFRQCARAHTRRFLTKRVCPDHPHHRGSCPDHYPGHLSLVFRQFVTERDLNSISWFGSFAVVSVVVRPLEASGDYAGHPGFFPTVADSRAR